jgi:hypothetical protein
MDRNDQSMDRNVQQGSQDRSLHGSDADRGTSDRGMQDRGSPDRATSGSDSRQGGYGDDTGRSMDAGGVEGGNRSDDRVGTSRNLTGTNRPNDVERMQGRPSEISDDRMIEGGVVERESEDRGDLNH